MTTNSNNIITRLPTAHKNAAQISADKTNRKNQYEQFTYNQHSQSVEDILTIYETSKQTGNNLSNSSNSPIRKNIETLNKIIADSLEWIEKKSTIQSSVANQSVLNTLIHAEIVKLKLQIQDDTDKTTQLEAKNKLFVLQHNLENAQNGLTSIINVNGKDLQYTPSLTNTPLSWLLNLFGNAGCDAAFTQNCNNTSSYTAITASVILFPIMVVFSESCQTLENNITTSLKLIKEINAEISNASNAIPLDNIEKSFTVAEAQKTIETLFKTIQNEGINAKVHEDYTSLLNQINNHINRKTADGKDGDSTKSGEDIKNLTMVTSKVKVAIGTTKSQTYRNTIPGLLHLLETLIYNDENNNTPHSSGNKAILKNIYQKCYPALMSDEHANNEKFSYTKTSKQLNNLIDNTDWDDRTQAYNALNQALFIFQQIPAENSFKNLLLENFISRTSIIKDKLKLHRMNLDWKAITMTSIGVFIVNIGVTILPLNVSSVNWLLNGTAWVNLIQAVGTGLSNGVCNASYLGPEWKTESVHGSSTRDTLTRIKSKKGDRNSAPIQQELSKLNNGKSSISTIDQLAVTLINSNEISKDNIEKKLDQFCTHFGIKDNKEDKKTLIKNILEYNVQHNGELVPLIYVLYDKVISHRGNAKDVLEYYYNNIYPAIGDNTAISENNDNTQQIEKNKLDFSNYLCKAETSFNKSALNLCKCLAILANMEKLDPGIAKSMGIELARALTNAKTDQKSNWFILTQPNHWSNFTLRFISGTLAYVTSIALTTFLSTVVPVLGTLVAAGAVVGIFTLKNLFDSQFAESYSTQELDKSISFLKDMQSKKIQPNLESELQSREPYYKPINYSEDNNIITQQLIPTLDKFKNYSSDGQNIELYVYELVSEISRLSYDTQSLLSLLKYSCEQLQSKENIDKNKIAILLTFAVESARFKDVLNDIRSDYMYQTMVGVVTSLIWATGIAPIIRTSFNLTISFINIANLIVGGGIGILEGMATASNAKKKFYEKLNWQEKPYKEATHN